MRQRDFPTSNKLNMNESDTLKSVYSFSLTYFSHWGCRFSTTAVDTFTPAQTPLSAGSNCVATSKYRVCTERGLANNELILAGNIITLCSKVMFTKKKKANKRRVSRSAAVNYTAMRNMRRVLEKSYFRHSCSFPSKLKGLIMEQKAQGCCLLD